LYEVNNQTQKQVSTPKFRREVIDFSRPNNMEKSSPFAHLSALDFDKLTQSLYLDPKKFKSYDDINNSETT